MRRSRVIQVSLVGVLVALAVAWFARNRLVVAGGEETVEAPPAALRSTNAAPRPTVSGPASGVVVDAHGAAVGGAVVRAFRGDAEPLSHQCGVCEADLFHCPLPANVRRLVGEIAQGSVWPEAIDSTVTDASGRFVFDRLPENATLIAIHEALAGAAVAGSEVTLTIAPTERRRILIQDLFLHPLAGVAVWVVMPETHEAASYVSGGDGWLDVSVRGENAFLATVDSRYVPAITEVSSLESWNLTVPASLVIHTVSGGEPIDAVVTTSLHEHEALKTVGGTVIIDDVPQILDVTLSAATATLNSVGRVVVPHEGVNEVTIELQKAATLSLTVVDARGAPVDEVAASLDSPNNNAVYDAKMNGLEGVFSRVPEGEYTLAVAAEGKLRFEEVIDLKAGAQHREITLHDVSVLEGRVLSDEGAVDGAQVTLFVPGEPPRTDFSSKGAFRFESSACAEAIVIASHPAFGSVQVSSAVPATVDLHLKRGAALKVKVTDDRGLALPQLDVAVTRAPAARYAVPFEPDATEGELAGLEAGGYTITASAHGYVASVQKVTLTANHDERVTLTLRRGVQVTGRVVDEHGAVPENTVVMVASLGENVEVLDGGVFELSGLEPGKQHLMVTVAGEPVINDLTVDAPSAGVLVRIPATQWVEGRVVDEQGRPVPQTDVNGEILEPSSRGAYRVKLRDEVVISAPDYCEQHLETPSAGALGTTVLKRIPTIEGEVVDPQGKPVASVNVSSGNGSTTTSSHGRFRVPIGCSDETTTLAASRGTASGSLRITPGSNSVRIVINPGTHLEGHVLASPGAGTLVTALMNDQRRTTLVDGEGRFSFDLQPGVWSLSALGQSRSVSVQGAHQTIELGGPIDRCVLELDSPVGIESIHLNAAQSTGGEGVMSMSGNLSRHSVFTGLPCGAFSVFVVGLSGSYPRAFGPYQVMLNEHAVLEVKLEE